MATVKNMFWFALGMLAAVPLAASAAPKSAEDMPSFCASAPDATCQPKVDGYERGTVRGYDVRIFSDSATVASVPGGDVMTYNKENWDIGCSRDKMTSNVLCLLYRGQLYLSIDKDNFSFISVGSDHFPGTTTSIKVGSKRFDTRDGRGDFPQRKQLLALMKDGTPIVTRHSTWPSGLNVDEEFTLHGMQAAMDVAKWGT
ncbi:MAG: hypothetical protein V4631_08965 [Pseudomonadota bacterium]